MKRWEYDAFVLAHEDDWANALDGMGVDGWELVAVVQDPSPDHVRLVFKRPLAEDEEE